MPDRLSVDGFPPPEIAERIEDAGVKKAHLPLLQMFLLSVLAGAFISLGGLFAACAMAGNGVDGAVHLPWGVEKLLGGLAFSLGLILVVIAGAELFTGNVLLIVATASRKISPLRLLGNWTVVYLGNFVGSLATAYLLFVADQYKAGNGVLGLSMLKIADAKCALPFDVALVRGIYCNALVCLAVWMASSGRTITDKILAIVFPITAFVALGFEHSVANMFFVPMAMLIKSDAAFWAGRAVDLTAFGHLAWRPFLIGNLIPVTLGNILGGAGFVGAIYWLIYRWPARPNGGNNQ